MFCDKIRTQKGEKSMLDQIMQNTIEYLLHFSKTQRKEYGQFFTGISTARYMASLVEPGRSKIRSDTLRSKK